MTHDRLFEPFTWRSLTLANRIVMAPMTRSFSPNGLPTEDVVAYYRRRAEGGVGLIITEGTSVNRPGARNDPAVPHFHGLALPLWKRTLEGVHAVGGKIAPQLWHVGAARNRKLPAWQPGPIDSPSGIGLSGDRVGEPMTENDIADTFAAYSEAARMARQLGFDAVELHGAHGYLIDEFFFDVTNRRTDRWGGETVAQRSRFAAQLVREVRTAIGPDFPLILRISQWKSAHYDVKLARTPGEMGQWLEPLVEAGVDIFHCSQRRFWEAEFPGSDLNFAGWVRQVTGRPAITVGSVGLTGDFIAGTRGESSRPASLNELMRRLDRGDFDLVAVGRALIVNSDWPRLIREGRTAELKDFDPAALTTLH